MLLAMARGRVQERDVLGFAEKVAALIWPENTILVQVLV